MPDRGEWIDWSDDHQAGFSRLWAGEDVKTILDDTAAQWDALTERIGVDEQRRAYQDWASKPNAYPNN